MYSQLVDGEGSQDWQFVCSLSSCVSESVFRTDRLVLNMANVISLQPVVATEHWQGCEFSTFNYYDATQQLWGVHSKERAGTRDWCETIERSWLQCCQLRRNIVVVFGLLVSTTVSSRGWFTLEFSHGSILGVHK